ncbi:DrmB family protein [Domibacillus indicus]|uniref:DrmB family protein n=1 Tax=Domibacillus indicus TaxID=1437523 RepID=UPI000617D6EE|nr:DrmB family protein [Domibacillus indicus]
MRDIPLRRSQLITTFGPGSLVVSQDGETALVGSLDKWYHDKDGVPLNSFGEYLVFEPRLQSLLGVNKLLAPPDFRASYSAQYKGSSAPQDYMNLYIPLLRYPTWHYCPHCRNLYQRSLSLKTNKIDCKKCQRAIKMIQVPFVIICEQGHISDFPWREWVHRNEHATCEKDMSLRSTGGSTLDSLKVVCECKAERSLKGIMSRRHTSGDDNGVSELSRSLNQPKGGTAENYYTCPGTRPWMGSLEEKENCNVYPIAALKNSINVYYSNTISAIYLPGENKEVDEIINMFEKYKITNEILDTHDTLKGKIKLIRLIAPPKIVDYTDEDIEQAILYLKSGSDYKESQEKNQSVELELRKKEYDTLIHEIDREDLKVLKEWDQVNGAREEVEEIISSYFGLLHRVTKLKETIVLAGFTRSKPFSTDAKHIQALRNGRELLFKSYESPENNWLPAFKVFGEGIFFTLDIEKLNDWENRAAVRNYFKKYLKRYKKATNDQGMELKPRSILLHTLSHLLIDQLALKCGYNTTSLKERLYLDPEQSGVLIYTSSGDSEGTFGGVVRMGRMKNFVPNLYAALNKALWCSSDPVCTEIGTKEGQGLDKLNGAACHSCSHLPETSCEHNNLLLDRTFLMDEEIGFFKDLNVILRSEA